MANAVKGEVGFDFEGEAYRLVLDFNALCEIEGVLRPGDDRNGPSSARATFWGALQRHHGTLSLADVGAMIARLTLPRVRQLIAEAYEVSGLNEVLGEDPRKAPARKRPKTGA